ncbi:MAG TPA: hypothetical protein PKD68_00790 [Candidatus Saccharibacteria bacterium]|nr:hypothetical protein [Candidatus Saccharibacteria bacterium]
MSKVKIVTFVPPEAAEAVRLAMGEAGAGKIGEYTFCSFSVAGNGRFKPSNETNPYSGKKNELNVENEERIEVVCDRSAAKQVIAAMRAMHPYEEVAFDIYPLIEENEL